MKSYEFKFNLGDKAYLIEHHYKNSYIECSDCRGEKIKLPSGKELECPRCKGKGILTNGQIMYYQPDPCPMTIGRQGVEISKEKTEEEYMCYETGVGSGSIYKAEKLFKSIDEATKESAKLNQELGDEYYCEKCQPNIATHTDYGYAKWKNCPIHGKERFWAGEETKLKLKEKWKKERDNR